MDGRAGWLAGCQAKKRNEATNAQQKSRCKRSSQVGYSEHHADRMAELNLIEEAVLQHPVVEDTIGQEVAIGTGCGGASSRELTADERAEEEWVKMKVQWVEVQWLRELKNPSCYTKQGLRILAVLEREGRLPGGGDKQMNAGGMWQHFKGEESVSFDAFKAFVEECGESRGLGFVTFYVSRMEQVVQRMQAKKAPDTAAVATASPQTQSTQEIPSAKLKFKYFGLMAKGLSPLLCLEVCHLEACRLS